MKITVFKIVIAMLLTGINTALSQTVQVDPNLKNYKKISGVSGNLNSIGSDTLNNLMTLWSEGFNRIYPNIKVQIEGKGSSTAPPALIEGTAQLGPMSREMKSKEEDKFESKFGYKPISIKVSIDALAVFVHKDNPINGLYLSQVDGLFSSTFKHGGLDLTSWGQLGLTGQWKNLPVTLYGRNSASGDLWIFQEGVLKKG